MSCSKHIAIWSDFAWTQVTTPSSALEALKAAECHETVALQGHDPWKITPHVV